PGTSWVVSRRMGATFVEVSGLLDTPGFVDPRGRPGDAYRVVSVSATRQVGAPVDVTVAAPEARRRPRPSAARAPDVSRERGGARSRRLSSEGRSPGCASLRQAACATRTGTHNAGVTLSQARWARRHGSFSADGGVRDEEAAPHRSAGA